MQNFEGKTAVVTGAASGIGKALAERAAAAGMNVVLADVDTDGIEAVADALDAPTATIRCDVAELDQVEAMAALATERFGGTHVLCNNAGVGGGGTVAELSMADWQWVLGVNLWGVIHGIQAFLPAMIASGEPCHVVNTASMAGHFAAPGMGPYSVSKFGVVALSETMRAEHQGSNVGVSVLCPGWVNTRIHESERNRPAELLVERPERPSEMQEMIRSVIETGHTPASVADRVFDAVANDRFWVFTHPDMVRALQGRLDDILLHTPEP